ncbi:MAG: hypothetical protein JWM34_4557 [Ilumatobacteraceae bacterium]|nr:hypothetical protein [Ilumatobacteraceae bacterium]
MTTVGAAVAVLASFGDWLRSGAVSRSSYDILGLVDRLGFAPDGPVHVAVSAWPLMPLLMTSAVVALWWGWRTVGAVIGVVAGVYAGGLGLAVNFAVPEAHEVSVGRAPLATAIGGTLVVAGSLATLVLGVRSAHANPR